MVNGHPIRRERVLGPLLRSRGVSTLEQVLVLDEAGRLAEQKGLTVTHAEVENEYGRALRQLVDPFAAWTTEHFDPVQAERILDAALAERNMSREEFRIGIRRNAYLRKIVESELRFTQKQLQAEYARTYGRRVQVRHIQLAGAREVEQVRSRLAAGEDFGAVARQFSANTMTASHGGLLDPFCETDDDVPELFRRTAFALRPGEVSKAIRIGPWIHILKWQRTLPAEHPDPAKVRTLLEEKLRDRQSDPAMAALYDRILKEANVRIIDPTLKHAYEATRADQ